MNTGEVVTTNSGCQSWLHFRTSGEDLQNPDVQVTLEIKSESEVGEGRWASISVNIALMVSMYSKSVEGRTETPPQTDERVQ